MNIPLFILVGILTGLLSGFFGVGGGIILVPILVLYFKFTQHEAQGISLMALLLPVGILGVLAYNKAHPIPFKPALWIALGIFVGAYFGSLGAQQISGKTLKMAFGVFMMIVGLKLAFGK